MAIVLMCLLFLGLTTSVTLAQGPAFEDLTFDEKVRFCDWTLRNEQLVFQMDQLMVGANRGNRSSMQMLDNLPYRYPVAFSELASILQDAARRVQYQGRFQKAPGSVVFYELGTNEKIQFCNWFIRNQESLRELDSIILEHGPYTEAAINNWVSKYTYVLQQYGQIVNQVQRGESWLKKHDKEYWRKRNSDSYMDRLDKVFRDSHPNLRNW